MQRYIVYRLLQGLVCVLGVTIIIFIITHLVGDPVRLLLPMDAGPEDYVRLRHSLGLDTPIWVQFLTFATGVIHGDFGNSFRFQEPALPLVLQRLPATLELAGAAMLVSIALGVPAGVIAAVKRGRALDVVARGVALFGQTAPSFWLALILILVFAVWLRVLPAAERGGIDHLVLPAVALGLSSVAGMTRLVRSAMLEVLDSEYIKLARIKGLPEWLVILKHGLRNAAITPLTLMGMQLASLIGGAVIIEFIFAWPGTGRLAVDSIFAHDYPVIQAFVFVASLFYIGINLVVDVLYAYVDPRIRYSRP